MSSGHIEDNRLIPEFWPGWFYSKSWVGNDNPSGDRTSENTYHAEINRRRNGDLTYWYDSDRFTEYRSTINWEWGSVPYLDLPWSDNDSLKLLNKAADKVRGGSFSLGNFIGEAPQTIRLIADTATRVAKMLHYIRDGNFYQAAKAVGKPQLSRGHVLSKKNRIPIKAAHVSDAVLELQYGWKPLLSDVHESAHALAERIEVPFKHMVRVTRQINESDDKPDVYGPVTWKRVSSNSQKMRIVYETQPTLSTALHLNDPLSVMWEVMPWSFVADWFLPIGDYLGAVDFYRNFGIKSIWVSSKYDRKITATNRNNGNTNISYFETGEPSYKQVLVVNRFELTPSVASLPTPNFKSMKQALNPEHLLNAFALLTSTTDGFRKQLKF